MHAGSFSTALENKMENGNGRRACAWRRRIAMTASTLEAYEHLGLVVGFNVFFLWSLFSL